MTGSPQGSVPGPFLFSLYKLPERRIISRNTIGPHSYADDTQLYISVTPPGYIKVDKLAQCFANIKLSTVEPGQSCNTIFCRQRPTGNSSYSLQFSVTQHYLSGPKLSCYARLRSNWSLLLRTSFYHLRNIAKVQGNALSIPKGCREACVRLYL